MLLGVLFLVMTGLTWSYTGSVVSECARKGGNYSFIQGFNAFAFLSIGLVVFSCIGGWGKASSEVLIRTGFLLMLSGIVNYCVMFCMSLAMKSGHNGIVFAICQSGTVCTFIMGVVFFGVEPTKTRIWGVLLILLGIILFGLSKKSLPVKQEDGKTHNWLYLSFLTFGLIGLAHCLSNIPSYLDGTETVPGVFRSGSSALGVLIDYIIYSVKNPEARKFQKLDFKYALILLFFGIITGYFLLYRGLDLVAEAGSGAIGYSILIGTCIAGFTLYSVFILREKISPVAWLGFTATILGIVLSALTF